MNLKDTAYDNFITLNMLLQEQSQYSGKIFRKPGILKRLRIVFLLFNHFSFDEANSKKWKPLIAPHPSLLHQSADNRFKISRSSVMLSTNDSSRIPDTI